MRPGPLDVVAELAAHQQNLEPPAALQRAALVALPPPPIATLIAADWFAAARSRALAAAAERLGGGDGPLPFVEFSSGSFQTRLGRLWHSGTRALFIHGMEDQPGLVRALRYRWPGSLHRIDLPGALRTLQAPGPPVLWLGEGVVRVAPGVRAPDGARCVLAAVDEDGDPLAVRAQGPHVWPFALDPELQLGLWSGALPPRGALGTADAGRTRERWEACWTEIGRPEVVRHAVLGLDPALESALTDRAAQAERPPRARIVAITGIDGSGKSTQAALLARWLGERGARTRVLKLYRKGAFLELADELGARTRRGAPLAAFRTSRIVKLIDSLRVHRDEILPALAECDVLIMDRYVETHVAAAASQLGWDLSRHPALAPFPPADLRFWLELDPEVALRRRGARPEPATADEHAVGLSGYAREFARLARGPGEVRLDATAAQEENARSIAEKLRPLLRPVGPPRKETIASSAAPAVRSRGAPPCLVHLGPREGLAELGAELFAIRSALSGWCGGLAAAAVPESFWLEAYAAQLLLDVRTLAPERACAALWPGALARMADHADLEMLRELERMLHQVVEIVAFDPRPAVYAASFAALGAHRAAAERLASDYAAALVELAGEAGWPRSA